MVKLLIQLKIVHIFYSGVLKFFCAFTLTFIDLFIFFVLNLLTLKLISISRIKVFFGNEDVLMPIWLVVSLAQNLRYLFFILATKFV